jgi:hypothetical protein
MDVSTKATKNTKGRNKNFFVSYVGTRIRIAFEKNRDYPLP